MVELLILFKYEFVEWNWFETLYGISEYILIDCEYPTDGYVYTVCDVDFTHVPQVHRL